MIIGNCAFIEGKEEEEGQVDFPMGGEDRTRGYWEFGFSGCSV